MLKFGDSFGELALINHENRAATIKSISSCYLAVLSKEDYSKDRGKELFTKMHCLLAFSHAVKFGGFANTEF